MTTAYWKGKKRSEETCRKISEAQKGKKANPKCISAMAQKNRENGKSRQSYNYKEWRRKILERDGGKCVKCQRQHEKMHCHHIIPWKEDEKLRFSVENGETLCASCHIKTGVENKEIDGSQTQFKHGQKPWIADQKGIIPWNKGVPMSEETKKKVSEAKKGFIPWNKGVPMSEEIKEKCRIANLGKNLSPKTEFKKGQVPWNKGKKGLQIAWNKGLKKELDNHIM